MDQPMFVVCVCMNAWVTGSPEKTKKPLLPNKKLS